MIGVRRERKVVGGGGEGVELLRLRHDHHWRGLRHPGRWRVSKRSLIVKVLRVVDTPRRRRVIRSP